MINQNTEGNEETIIPIAPSIISEALHYFIDEATDANGDCYLPPWKVSTIRDALAKLDPPIEACMTADDDNAHDLLGRITLRKVTY